MKILAFDTSSEVLSIALYENTVRAGFFHSCCGLKHSEKFAQEVKDLIRSAGWSFKQLDLIACGAGPGSFTGIRIAISSMKAIASVSGAKVLGLSSFLGSLHGMPEDATLVAPLLDARKGNVYCQVFRRQTSGNYIAETGHMLKKWDMIACELEEEVFFFGDGVDKYLDELKSCENARIDIEKKYIVRADILALEAFKKSESAVEDVDSVEPMYLYPKTCTVKNESKNEKNI